MFIINLQTDTVSISHYYITKECWIKAKYTYTYTYTPHCNIYDCEYHVN